MNDHLKILAIESSCDETAAAVIGTRDGSPILLSNIISSQVDLHAKTGGVVPEVASRAHMEAITPVINEALIVAQHQESRIKNQVSDNSSFSTLNSDFQEAISFLKSDITHIAVTYGPGLIGSLLVGFNAAKSLAYSLDKPIIPVHHIAGHIASALAEEAPNTKYQIPNGNEIRNYQFPLLALVVSGGHSSLIYMEEHGSYETIGQTLDDAAGEAYDKVAKLLDLGYPGGPKVSKLATEYRGSHQNGAEKAKIIFPRPLLSDGSFNFSFSGLKTAVLREVKEGGAVEGKRKLEIAAAFEEAVAEVLVTKTLRAVLKYKPKTVVLAGGVAANSYLRQELQNRISETVFPVELRIPPLSLCGDNAAMIGLAGYFQAIKNNVKRWDEISVDSNAKLTQK